MTFPAVSGIIRATESVWEVPLLKKIYDAVDRFCARHPRFGIPNLMRYIVIGTAAAGRLRPDAPLKLLPPAGSYQVRIGGRPARLTVDTSQNLIIRDGCPDGRAVLTF